MYTFTDTVRTDDINQTKGSEAFRINNVYPEDVVSGYRTLYANGREFFKKELKELKIEGVDGSRIMNSRDDSRTITVGYQLICEDSESLIESFNELNRLLSQKDARFIFDDEKDKYFTGMVVGMDNIPSGRISLTAEFSIYCPDPHKYSVVQKEFTADIVPVVDQEGQETGEDSGVRRLTIENMGNEPADISYRVINGPSENGFVGFVSSEGVLQYGDPSEEDTMEEDYSVEYIGADTQEKVSQLPDAISGISNYAWAHWGSVNYPTNGNWKNDTWYGQRYVVPNSFGGGSGWRGPKKAIDLGENAGSNFRFDNTFYFQNYAGHAIGAYEVTIADANRKRIACIWIYNPNNKWVNWIECDIEVNQRQKASGQWLVKTASPFEYKLIIDKKGSNISFNVCGKSFQYNDSALENVEARYIVITAMAKDANYAWMGLKSVSYRKDKLTRTVDIPNRYRPYSTLNINGVDGTADVDGVNATGDECIGSKHFKAPPGAMVIDVATSDFCTIKPVIKAVIRERWK